jgi:hypothetical protein
MGKPSIYSKTRAQLRSDLALAIANSTPNNLVDAAPESFDTHESGAGSLNGFDEEEAV